LSWKAREPKLGKGKETVQKSLHCLRRYKNNCYSNILKRIRMENLALIDSSQSLKMINSLIV
jgi:hypothetical protein